MKGGEAKGNGDVVKSENGGLKQQDTVPATKQDQDETIRPQQIFVAA